MNAVVELKPQVPAEIVTPMTMIDRALGMNASPETLERLLALQERFEANEARKAFEKAMAAAKAEIPVIQKNRTAGFESRKTGEMTSYNYETLDQVTKTIDPVLTRHGLSYRFQSAAGEGGQIKVTCLICHEAGHKTETALASSPDASGSKNSVQAIGSAVTYLQRYTLKLALGLAAAADDDAKTGIDHTLITAEQFQILQDLIERSGSDEKKLLAAVKADALEKLNVSQFDRACTTMRGMIAKRKAANVQ